MSPAHASNWTTCAAVTCGVQLDLQLKVCVVTGARLPNRDEYVGYICKGRPTLRAHAPVLLSWPAVIGRFGLVCFHQPFPSMPVDSVQISELLLSQLCDGRMEPGYASCRCCGVYTCVVLPLRRHESAVT